MKPETSAYLQKSRLALAKARRVQDAGIPDEAARIAYTAQLCAARALIFERTDRATKTHRGAWTLFAQLVRASSTLDQQLPTLLNRSYHFKQLTDYETGAAAEVTAEEAANTIADAEQLVRQVELAIDTGTGQTDQ